MNSTSYYSTQQYCHAEFWFKFFDKMVNKRDILKISNLDAYKCNISGPQILQEWRYLEPQESPGIPWNLQEPL